MVAVAPMQEVAGGSGKTTKTRSLFEFDFYRDVSLPVSEFLEAEVVPAWTTPNMITWFGTCSFMFGFASFFFEDNHLFMFTGILTQHICDDLDGVVARKRNQCSPVGEFLDHSGDRTAFLLIYYSLLKAHPTSKTFFILVLEVMTGILKLVTNFKTGEMPLDDSGSVVRYGSWLYHLVRAIINHRYGRVLLPAKHWDLVWWFCIILSIRQLIYQLRCVSWANSWDFFHWITMSAFLLMLTKFIRKTSIPSFIVSVSCIFLYLTYKKLQVKIEGGDRNVPVLNLQTIAFQLMTVSGVVLLMLPFWVSCFIYIISFATCYKLITDLESVKKSQGLADDALLSKKHRS